MVNLTTGDISDSAGAQTIVAAIRKRWPWLKHLGTPNNPGMIQLKMIHCA